jgi:membrane-bound serine protease (ClpP class)
MLLAGAMLVAFEVFQPGFGIAGVTGAALLAAAIYGMTVLPISILGAVIFGAGIALLTVDVALNELGIATIAGAGALAYGSLAMFPAPAGALGLPGWLAGIGVVAALIYFVPVMTLVRRSRRDPETQRAARSLVGMPGQVRSMLNPEGFVWVADGLWRARSDDGSRMRVGEDVVVTATEGILLRVRRS